MHSHRDQKNIDQLKLHGATYWYQAHLKVVHALSENLNIDDGIEKY